MVVVIRVKFESISDLYHCNTSWQKNKDMLGLTVMRNGEGVA